MASQKDAHVSFRNEHMENFDNEVDIYKIFHITDEFI